MSSSSSAVGRTALVLREGFTEEGKVAGKLPELGLELVEVGRGGRKGAPGRREEGRPFNGCRCPLLEGKAG